MQDQKSTMAKEKIWITFRSRIQPGESSFVVPIQHKFINNSNPKFSFESITLMPEYQNTQAFVYNLDSKKELEAEMTFPLQLEVTYGPDYYTKDDGGKTWNFQPSKMQRIDSLLLSINQHFDQYKPAGTFYPPVFVDWIHLNALEEGETIRGYQQETAMLAYGEVFKQEKHATWLPNSLQHMDELNNCIFPTANEKGYLDGVRLRLWVSPNTEVTFSNKNLPITMGFQGAQIPAQNKRGQVPYVNDDPFKYTSFVAWDSPTLDISLNSLKGTKIHCYTRKNVITSPETMLSTQKQKEKDPLALCIDFSKTIASLAKKMNFYMDLQFDKTIKKFKFIFPPNDNITVRVFVPKAVLNMLGYDSTQGECITKRSVPSSISMQVDAESLDKKAFALVFDTGMVAVDLYEQTSHLSSHSGTTLMATLHPQKDGTLTNRSFYDEMPHVNVSKTNPDLKFMLYRFDDDNRKFQLDWPVGAYIFGTLIGKV